MRFYVPNMEEQSEKSEEGDGDKEMEDGNKEKGEGDAEGEGEEKADDKEENSEDEITPAKLFNDKIVKLAGIGDQAGDVIASFQDLSLIVPRGKYTLNMFSNYAKFHGRTHDYKIMYKDIVKMF